MTTPEDKVQALMGLADEYANDTADLMDETMSRPGRSREHLHKACEAARAALESAIRAALAASPQEPSLREALTMLANWVDSNVEDPAVLVPLQTARAALAVPAVPQEPTELDRIQRERIELLALPQPTEADERRFRLLTERMRELAPSVTPKQWMELGKMQAALSAPPPTWYIKPGETVQQAAESWALWCEQHGYTRDLPVFIRFLARALEVAVAKTSPAAVQAEPTTGNTLMDAYLAMKNATPSPAQEADGDYYSEEAEDIALSKKRKAEADALDAARLDWLAENEGCNLISDDDGRWAVSTSGFQPVPEEGGFKEAVQIVSWVEPSEWFNSPRAAIDSARAAASTPAPKEKE
jgi:hypothetical protein